jgi:hypothetical protein
MNTIRPVLAYNDTLVTPYSLTAGFLMPNENLSYYEVSITSDFADADANPAALSLDEARWESDHAL